MRPPRRCGVRRGRRLIGWDEILEGGLAPRAGVQSWRGTSAGVRAANAGHDVVMSPTSHCYLDYGYQRTPVEKTYSFEPVPPGVVADGLKHILGVECCMWLGNVSTRHLEQTGEILPPAGIDYQMFPRAIALGEVGSSPRESRDRADFRRRLERHQKRLELLGVHFSRDGWQSLEGPCSGTRRSRGLPLIRYGDWNDALDGLVLDPCIPSHWERYELVRHYRGRLLRVTVENPQGKNRSVKRLRGNGQELAGNRISALPEGPIEVQAVIE
jgi:hypothetical protein